jgi:tetratricopeptide (TPR) repeat protein
MELAATGCYEEAMRNFDIALELRSDFPEALYSRGGVYIATGHYEEAIGNYERALKLRPDFPDAFRNREMVVERLSAVGPTGKETVVHYRDAPSLSQMTKTCSAATSYPRSRP